MLFTSTQIDDRMHPLRDAEFDDLDRYENGRLVQLSDLHHLLTEKQVEQLHEDDWSYYNELQEELNIELKQFLEHNGGLT